MTDDDDDWAPPPVPDGDGDPAVAVDEALTEAEVALCAFAWLPDADEVDAAATILYHLDPARRTPQTPLRRVLHQALGETYPQLTTWRPRPPYLYAAVKTLHQLASDGAAGESSAALLVGWDRLTVLLHAVTATAGGPAGSPGAAGGPDTDSGPDTGSPDAHGPGAGA